MIKVSGTRLLNSSISFPKAITLKVQSSAGSVGKTI